MRIVILAVGSRGDVQPHLALGLGLKEAGHSVRFATHAKFEDFVETYGVEFFPLAGDLDAYLRSDAGRGLFRAGPSQIKFINAMVRFYRSEQASLERDMWNACQGAEAIIHSTLALPAMAMGRALGVPSIHSALQPLDRLVKSWGPLRRLEREAFPTIYGFSPTLIPRSPAWGPSIHLTGFWFLDRPPGWEPSAALVEFIGAGQRPVSVGFGSMVDDAPEALTRMVLDALERTGQRAVLLSGWGGLSQVDLPPWAHMVDAVPYDWLFPHMGAVIHHGGPGTVAEGLRAGVPNVCVPYFGCQFIWGPRVAELGAGPAVIPRAELTTEALAAAIRKAVTDPSIGRRAQELGARIGAEDGVGRAVEAVHRILQEAGLDVPPSFGGHGSLATSPGVQGATIVTGRSRVANVVRSSPDADEVGRQG